MSSNNRRPTSTQYSRSSSYRDSDPTDPQRRPSGSIRKQESNESLTSSISSTSSSGQPNRSPPSSTLSSRRTNDEAIRRNIEMELNARKRRAMSTLSSSSSGLPVMGSQGQGSRSRPGSEAQAATARGPQGRPKRGTVAAMNPTPAVALHESAKVVEAAAHMAAKRVDAVLIVDNQGHLSGIITDKDMTFRVVAEGLDPRSTLVSEVMTHNPVSVVTVGSAADALNKMVAGHFRHLPVVDDVSPDDPDTGGGVVAVLDITKCLYDSLEKLDRLYESSRHRLEQPTSRPSSSYASVLRDHLAFPDLSSLLNADGNASPPPVVALGDTVLEAARRMRGARETAALDLVLRVLAAGLDPATTPVVRVMTPHPDCVTPETPVIDALRKMHAGRYLHLPVVDPSGVVEGLVDLNSLQTDPSLEGGQLWNRFWESGSGGSVHGGSVLDGSDNESDVSVDPNAIPHSSQINGSNPQRRRPSSNLGGQSNAGSRSGYRRNTPAHINATSPPDYHHLRTVASPSPSNESVPDDSTVLPEDSASRVAVNVDPVPPPIQQNRRQGSTVGSPRRGPPGTHQRAGSTLTGPTASHSDSYTFKLRDLDTGKIHRLVVSPSNSLSALTAAVLSRLGPSHPRFPSPPTPWISLSYIDDEGDTVHLGSDDDLEEAVTMAAGAGWNRVMLCMDAQVVGVGVGRFLGGGGSGASILSFGGSNRAESDAGSVDVGFGRVGSTVSGRKGEMDVLAPVLVGTGIAIVCAFLLGRAFR
ncbi:hypothetical protein BC829DRAFT_445647 [Chytridium lagenaria]|nr:hypothetical protein BC829DRAFT_445647 [Chytridium lagenaria]